MVRASVDDVVLEDEVLDVIVANSRLYAGGLFNLSLAQHARRRLV